MAAVENKLAQRGLGAVMSAGMAALVVYLWHRSQETGTFNPKLVAIPAAFAVLGLALLLFPIDWDAHEERHGTRKLSGFRTYPVAYQVALVLGLLTGVGVWLFFSYGMPAV